MNTGAELRHYLVAYGRGSVRVRVIVKVMVGRFMVLDVWYK